MLRYNFNPQANSRLGATYSDDTRAQMSKSQQLVDRSGENHPLFGRTGANHPMFGKSHTEETRAQHKFLIKKFMLGCNPSYPKDRGYDSQKIFFLLALLRIVVVVTPP